MAELANHGIPAGDLQPGDAPANGHGVLGDELLHGGLVLGAEDQQRAGTVGVGSGGEDNLGLGLRGQPFAVLGAVLGPGCFGFGTINVFNGKNRHGFSL